MTPTQATALIAQMLSTREGEVLTPEVIVERARNIAAALGGLTIGEPLIDSRDAVIANLLAACENLENDDGSIPAHSWRMVRDAVAKAKGES